MSIPLSPSTTRQRSVENPNANLGLVFDKYFGGWNDTFDALSEAGPDGKTTKSKWVNQIVDATARTNGAKLDALAARQRELTAALGGVSWSVTLTSRFVTGTGIANPLENGFVFHPTLAAPYLPASGLKGAVKAFWTQWQLPAPDAQTLRIFGEDDQVGTAVFFDMLPLAPVKLVAEIITPHYGPWYQNGDAPGDWHSPKPIPFIAMETGATFQISIAPRGRPVSCSAEWATDVVALKAAIGDALMFTGAGAKTAVGYGRFSGEPAP